MFVNAIGLNVEPLEIIYIFIMLSYSKYTKKEKKILGTR